MKHRWISCIAEPKAVLKEQRPLFSEDHVNIYRASVVFQFVPVEVLCHCLLYSPGVEGKLSHIPAGAADILSKVTSKLAFTFEVQEARDGLTVSNPEIERRLSTLDDFLKKELRVLLTTEGRDVLTEFLIGFREVFTLLRHVSQGRVPLERFVDVGFIFMGLQET